MKVKGLFMARPAKLVSSDCAGWRMACLSVYYMLARLPWMHGNTHVCEGLQLLQQRGKIRCELNIVVFLWRQSRKHR